MTARKPIGAELAILREAFETNLKRYSEDGSAASALLQFGDSPLDTKLNTTEWAAYTSIARLLLNSNEAITKG